jgi:hypothetical protein
MNIFVTNLCPVLSAVALPDKYSVKMPVETCQMVSIIYSKWYYDWGTISKKDGSPYNTEKGAFRGHPCTIWTSESIDNSYWLIKHGMNICDEFQLRYDKPHGCYKTLLEAYYLFPKGKVTKTTPFVRAMPDELKIGLLNQFLMTIGV